MGERGPLYQYIEFCRNTQTLWHKLQSGHWDWLGRKLDGTFVLGRPRVSPESFGIAAITVTAEDGKQGEHGVKLQQWHGQPSDRSSSRWFSDADTARDEFEEDVRRLEDPTQNPILARLVLIQNGSVTDERFIAQVPPPNYQ